MSKLQRFIRKQKLKQLVRKISKLIYSDTFPISSESDQEVFISKLANKSNKIYLLETYLTVQLVTRDISYSTFNLSITDQDIEEILNDVDRVQEFSNEVRLKQLYNETLDVALQLNLLRAKRHLRLTSYYFERGREAYKRDQYSFEGMRYIKEKNNKRPLSLKEKKGCENSSNEIAELGIKVNEAEEKYQAAVSKLAAQVELEKIKQEVEGGAKLKGEKDI